MVCVLPFVKWLKLVIMMHDRSSPIVRLNFSAWNEGVYRIVRIVKKLKVTVNQR